MMSEDAKFALGYEPTGRSALTHRLPRLRGRDEEQRRELEQLHARAAKQAF